MIRPANMDDLTVLWRMRNHPDSLYWSHNPIPVGLGPHQDWFYNALSSPDHVINIAEEQGKAVGYARLTARWEVSFYVAPEARGEGLGKRLLKSVEVGDRQKVAIVDPGNGPSLGAFRAAGYRNRGGWTVCTK